MEKQIQTGLVFYVGFLRYFYLLYQNFHWQSSGSAFYSSHLLFERLYKQVADDVDEIAEKTIGLCNKEILKFTSTLDVIDIINQKFPQDHPCNCLVDQVEFSLKLEREFQAFLVKLKKMLDDSKQNTLGLDDLIASHASSSETRIYLLKANQE